MGKEVKINEIHKYIYIDKNRHDHLEKHPSKQNDSFGYIYVNAQDLRWSFGNPRGGLSGHSWKSFPPKYSLFEGQNCLKLLDKELLGCSLV